MYIMSSLFEVQKEELDERRHLYRLYRSGVELKYMQAIDELYYSGEFRAFFNKLLADSHFQGFRWETPGVTLLNSDRLFEFVLLDAPNFVRRQTDRKSFANKLSDTASDSMAVSFKNLSGDANLIVPCEKSQEDIYGHLASFIRGARDEQLDAFWNLVAVEVKRSISHDPVWLSTAGGGVAWLHVRIDRRPKYYGHDPYKRVSIC